MHDLEGPSPVRQLVEGASRRSMLVLAVEHAAIALAALFGGLILLLLLGTQVLAWPWMLLVLALGVSVAYFRLRGRILDRYRIAQFVDKRLASSDTLSTAWFLLERPPSDSSVFAPAQIGRAETLARQVSVKSIFPFVWRRSWAVAGVLAALACSLFALRYLVIHTLNLKPALVSLTFPEPAAVVERIEKFLKGDSPAAASARAAQDTDLRRQEASTRNERPQPPGTPAERAADKARGKGSGEKSASASHSPDDPLKPPPSQGAPGAQAKSADRGESAENHPPDGKLSDRRPSAEPSFPRSNDAQEQSPGVMDRMKDALSGMMAKVRPPAAPKSEQNRQNEPKTGEQSSKTGARNAEANQNSSSSQQTDGENQQQTAQGQPQASEKSPGAQSKSAEEGASQKGSDHQSGIGRQDGDKTLKEAEQLRAMGKLDEIIGKRSASLMGDITVETRSGNQQLKTQYSDHLGHHADLGGEIDRNEVPLPLQRYVRQYMEQVRKQAGDQ